MLLGLHFHLFFQTGILRGRKSLKFSGLRSSVCAKHDGKSANKRNNFLYTLKILLIVHPLRIVQIEGMFLLAGHLGLAVRRLVTLTGEVQQTVREDAQQFAFSRCADLGSIALHGVQ